MGETAKKAQTDSSEESKRASCKLRVSDADDEHDH